MPGTPGTRTNLASVLTGDASTAERTTINAIIAWLEANAALTASGLFADRPISTPSTPGIQGRSYYATDQGITYIDTGTGWVRPDPVQRAPQGPETNLKIIRGIVGGAGTVITGSGWTVVHNATGDYTVTYTTPFSADAAPTVTPVFAGGAVAHRLSARAAGSFRVQIYLLSGGANIDSDFSFTTIGPA